MNALLVVLFLCISDVEPSPETCVYAPLENKAGVAATVTYFDGYEAEAKAECEALVFEIFYIGQRQLDKDGIKLTITANDDITCTKVVLGV
jgi:hypothetical protein|tara:strand:+ start:1517 stop:1789 length:273 start_codon:yes stop_codon:yes gene_type:complete